MAQESHELLDPKGDWSEEQNGDQIPLAERFNTLNGKKIKLYTNNKANADHFLTGIKDEILSTYPDAEFDDDIVYKPTSGNPGSDYGLIEDIAPEYDAVLIAYGDCGSCTTYTIHDAVEFEKRGVPTVCYTSTKFIDLAQYEVYYQNCPGLPIVVFPHPIRLLPEEEVRSEKVTDEVVEETLFGLTGSRSEIEEEFSGRYSPEDFDGKPSFDRCTF